ncbi:glycerate kinase type-2 family protein [Neoroseomonas oryzicola]|uniref:Glycerate kinase n=1 Tax=Neoroseomonas oryzicola TaxID=535904 RepID=A0A9X9WC66_9PROT|nr:glycerate kinase [Neoroseomonas oryzicola]MBR0657926.1 glycerate kinase [Neoroseomonas oryzicola]NKE18756.1 glycerate kinase [Neoroseomonas oryzicola]
MAFDDAAARAALRRLFDAAVAAADPRVVLARHLPERPSGRVLVLGAGKSAAVMAAAVEAAWPDADLSGLVVTRYGHGHATTRIEVAEASHPVPDEAGARAAQRMLDLAAAAGPQDLVLFLVSGGGSSLTTLPAPGLSLPDLIAVNKALLASGATIHEMNCIRRHLSAFSGGRLAAAAHPARVVTLAISDVPGDDPTVIASGPTVPDPSTFAEARALVAHYRMALPAAVTAHLAAGAEESPKPGDPRLGTPDYRFIATPQMALEAAAAAARTLGLAPLILGDALEGEAREVGTVLAGIALSARTHGHPLPAPCVLLSGGETTVTIRAETPGRGGRNGECLLGCTLGLAGAAGVWALMGDTDGIDGSEENAGAIAAPDTLARARAAGLDPRALLSGHDSHRLFSALGDLVTTGPTLTNVNDFRAILVA